MLLMLQETHLSNKNADTLEQELGRAHMDWKQTHFPAIGTSIIIILDWLHSSIEVKVITKKHQVTHVLINELNKVLLMFLGLFWWF